MTHYCAEGAGTAHIAEARKEGGTSPEGNVKSIGVIMCRKSLFLGLTYFLVFLHCGIGSAGTWYVNKAGKEPRDGWSMETGFETIQEGIDASSHGDTVIVAEGTYIENIRFNGKNIVLRSTDPLDPTIVANTIIDGNQAGSVVAFSGSETEACVLSGFTVRNGKRQKGGGILGGTDPVLTSATIQNNTISGNSAWFGGGLCYCNVILNCIIWGNVAAGSDPQILGSSPTYSCLQDWTGGGDGNIALDPQFVDPDGPDDDPLTSADNDYRLSAGSPCIDMGMNEDWMWSAADLDGNPRILYGGSSVTVDMGAYEFL